MNYVWENDTEQQIPGVTETLVCRGEMYSLEVQCQDDGTVVGTVWREISATFWEPADVDCVLEEEYTSVDAAKEALVAYDIEEAEAQARFEEELGI